MAKLPVNVSAVREAFREVGDVADRSATILLAGDQRLVSLAQARFADGGPTPGTFGGSPSELGALSTYPGELLVILVPAEDEAAVMEALEWTKVQGSTVLAVDNGAEADGTVVRLSERALRFSFADTARGWTGLFAACANAADDDLVALGRRYAPLRDYAAQRVVSKTAGQNALIGLLVFLPGADMPAMTLNQIKMVLNLASLNGQKVGTDRALELVGVVGLSFGFRAVARRLLPLVPGFGWLYKALIGYVATTALGMGMQKYFEAGAPASTEHVVALVRDLRR